MHDDEQQPGKQREHIGHVSAELLPDTQIGEAQRHQQPDAHRRQEQPDADGGRLHDVEVDRVDTHGLREWEHHGDQHNRGRQPLEQHAEQAAQDSGADQEQPGMRLERREDFPEQLRHAAHTHQILVDRSDGQQEHDDRRQDSAVIGNAAHLAPRDVPVIEFCGEESVARDDGAGLGRRDHAEDEAGQDDDRHHERHGCMQRGMAEAPEAGSRIDRPILLARADVDHGHQAQHDHDCRNEAGDKQRHGRCVGHLRNHDHEDRRWNQHPHRGACRDQRRRVAPVVAGLGQWRHQRRAECGDLRHLGSADVGEEIGDDDDGHAEAALDPADQRPRQFDQRMTHAAAFHQIAGEHERRDGKQHPALRSRYQGRGELLQRIAAKQEPGNACDRERKHDRHREQDQAEENDRDDRKQHYRDSIQ